MSLLEMPLQPLAGSLMLARVSDDLVESLPISDHTDRFVSEFLDLRCRLVYLLDESVRLGDPAYGRLRGSSRPRRRFPFLADLGSLLTDLNARLKRPVPMNRFRSNLVVRGCEPFAGGDWKPVRIGPIAFRMVKPCARCHITTVHHRGSGNRRHGQEIPAHAGPVRRCGTGASSDRA